LFVIWCLVIVIMTMTTGLGIYDPPSIFVCSLFIVMTIGYDASRAFVTQKTGTETYSFQLLKALLELNSPHTFWVYVRGSAGEENSRAFRDLQSLALGNRQRVRFIPISWPYLWTQGGLAWETWRNPPDILFIPAHVVPLFKNPRVPAVVTVHDLGLEYLPHYGSWKEKLYLGWFMEELRARLAAHIVAVSEATKRDVVEKLHVPEGKVSVVYEGVDLSNYKLRITNYEKEKVKRKYGIKGEYILFVGTVQPRKNLVRLIEAFSLVKGAGEKKSPKEKGLALKNSQSQALGNLGLGNLPTLQLVIAGKPGWNYEEIYAAPRKFGVEGRVKFLDFVPSKDLPVLYAGAKLLCLPSLHEGFGLPVLESMSAGTPVVISSVSSLPEVGGSVAEYVDPNDVKEIARGILRVLRYDKLAYHAKVERGKEWAARFSWKNAARETLKILERVAQ